MLLVNDWILKSSTSKSDPKPLDQFANIDKDATQISK